MIYIKMLKECVIAVEWNKPLNTPIPVSRDPIAKLSYPSIPEYSNIKMATRLNNIDLSRLKVTARLTIIRCYLL